MSETSIDRKAAEWLVQAIAPQPTPQPPLQHDKQTVGADDGDIKKVPRVRGPWEEEDDSDDDEGGGANASNLNKEDESASTEVKEEEEEEEPIPPLSPKPPLFDSAPLLKEDWSGDGAAVQSLRLENCGLRGAGLEVLGELPRQAQISKCAPKLTHEFTFSERLASLGGQARLASQEPDQPRRRSVPRHHDARLPTLDRFDLGPLLGTQLAGAQLADHFPERLLERDDRGGRANLRKPSSNRRSQFSHRAPTTPLQAARGGLAYPRRWQGGDDDDDGDRSPEREWRDFKRREAAAIWAVRRPRDVEDERSAD